MVAIAPAVDPATNAALVRIRVRNPERRLKVGMFAQARSGLPFNIPTGVDNNRDTTINERPDLANPDGDPRLASTYNTAFTGRVGNLSRNFGRGDAYFEAHLRSQQLRLVLHEIQVVCEMFQASTAADSMRALSNYPTLFESPNQYDGAAQRVQSE